MQSFMRSARLLAFTTAIFLTACTPPTQYPDAKTANAPAQPPVQRARQAYLHQSAMDPVSCSVGTDCTDKWAHALEWVNIHSQYSIKTSNDKEITTYGPIEPTTDAAFTITRTSADAATMAINFTADCGKNAHCVPTVLELNADFKNYLLTGVTQRDY